MLVLDEGKLLNSSNNNKNRLKFFSGKHETNSCVAPYFSAAQIVVFVGRKSRERERERERESTTLEIDTIHNSGVVLWGPSCFVDPVPERIVLHFLFCRPNANLHMQHSSWIIFF